MGTNGKWIRLLLAGVAVVAVIALLVKFGNAGYEEHAEMAESGEAEMTKSFAADDVEHADFATTENRMMDKEMLDTEAKGEISPNAAIASERTQDMPERMVIYRANLQLKTKDFDGTQAALERKVKELGGYIVNATVSNHDQHAVYGDLEVRIPHDQLDTFLQSAEGLPVEVMAKQVSGSDVTEEYVDVTSRLDAKRVVEERLLGFMKDAVKTADLLTISNELARVQEEIEAMTGRKQYLENQSSLATVSIHLFEEKVIVPDIEKAELDTWEKTKKQFNESINDLLALSSGAVVFLLGSSPKLFVLALVVAAILYFVRRRRKKREAT